MIIEADAPSVWGKVGPGVENDACAKPAVMHRFSIRLPGDLFNSHKTLRLMLN